MSKRYIPGIQAPEVHNVPDGSRRDGYKPSRWQYGSGARRPSLQLPPISRCATSVPTGSRDASHWPANHAWRNRP